MTEQIRASARIVGLTALLAFASLVECSVFATEAAWQARMDEGKAAAARNDLSQALSKYQQALKEVSDESMPAGFTFHEMARLFASQERHSEAESNYKRSISIFEKARPQSQRNLAAALLNLGVLYLSVSRLREAEAVYLRALGINEKTLKPDDMSLGTTTFNIASLYRYQKRYPEAEAFYKRSISILEKHPGARREEADSLGSLGLVYKATQRYPEAEAVMRRALAIRESLLSPNDRNVLVSLTNLGQVLSEQGRYREAEPMLARASAGFEKAAGPLHKDLGLVLDSYAVVLARQDRHKEAEPLFRRAIDVLEKTVGRSSAQIANVAHNLGVSLNAQRRYAEAGNFFGKAIEILDVQGADLEQLAQNLSSLSSTYQAQQKWAEALPLARRALEIAEKAHGPISFQAAKAAFDLGLPNIRLKREQDALAVYLRSLAILEKIGRTNTNEYERSLSNLGSTYALLENRAEAERFFKKLLDTREKRLGPEHPDVGNVYEFLGRLSREQGRQAESEEYFRRALAIQQKSGTGNKSSTPELLTEVAFADAEGGDFGQAESRLRNVLAMAGKSYGEDSVEAARASINLAIFLRRARHFTEAEALDRRALAIYRKRLGDDHVEVAVALSGLANGYLSSGRAREGEEVALGALQIREKRLGTEHREVAASVTMLAQIYVELIRYSQAEGLYRRAQSILERISGAETELADVIYSLGVMFKRQGRIEEAKQHYERALALYEKHLGSQHSYVADALSNLGGLYGIFGEPYYRRALSIYEKAQRLNDPGAVMIANNLAGALEAQGRLPESEELYKNALGAYEKIFGSQHIYVADVLSNLAKVSRRQKKFEIGLAYARQSSTILKKVLFADPSAADGLISIRRSKSVSFDHHVALLADFAEARPEPFGINSREAFEIAQLARASDASEQLAKMAARFASGTDSLAKLVRERQDLLRKSEEIGERLIAAFAKSGPERDFKSETKSREEQKLLWLQVSKIDELLTKDHPKYGELVSVRPLQMQAAQKLLGDDEALVFFLLTRDESFVWVVRKSRQTFRKLGVDRQKIDGMVKRLREQLDPSFPDAERFLDRPFDGALAHELYLALFGNVQDALQDARHLIVIPDAALQSLPFSTLLETPPTGPLVSISRLTARRAGTTVGQGSSVATFGAYADQQWLAKKYAITILPSVSSLRALRAFEHPTRAGKPFLGVGDPILGSGESGARSRRPSLNELFSRGAVANVTELKKMARLPDSADELKAIAGMLQADAGNLYLGDRATETNVKGLDLSAYRIVAFATHGLLAGEISGVAEPALVLTPPRVGSESDDGLLTASEIARLKLDADWVILSACNTAASDGTPGADGLSGLAKGFFYAGARSLLVSHWAVNSQAAVAVTTGMFLESAKGVAKSEALRRAMLSLMERSDTPHFAHPSMWAPFNVVGEGNHKWGSSQSR